ncbi:MAG: 6-phosphogluconolactonase [Pseudomonadales bacterium]|nr:6-phosphogluconolactonase [Pseudomonadales bacterium]
MNFTAYESRTAASAAAAELIGKRLADALQEFDETALLVSGGSSPAECLAMLSAKPLDWSRVRVSLTDERCVPVTDEASNEKMVRRQLLRENASKARFVALSKRSVGELAPHIACALIGMGEDGHFASLFPDNPKLAQLLDPAAEPDCMQITTAASEVNRITANLSLLLAGSMVVLLIFGEKKKVLIEQPGDLPVASLLKQQRVPVSICWAP